jgi:ADP-ribose pyrophosphatase YjhB (NUDIX family)
MGMRQIMVRTRGVVFDESGRLLVQHHSGQAPGFYRLPGGGVRFREKLEDCLVREISEETGLAVTVCRLLWVRDFVDRQPYHSIEIFFLAKVIGGEFNPTPEGEDMRLLFVSLEELDNVVFYPREFLSKLKILRENTDWAEENPYVRSAN